MRIRKITSEEAWRLMGFSNEDYLKASKYVCKTQLYKQADKIMNARYNFCERRKNER